MNYVKYIIAKLKYHYYRLILLIRFNRKPDKDGYFDLMPTPAFKDAVLIKNDD